MNIAITNYCNLQCPYCFANKFIQSKKEMITEEQLDNILDFSIDYLKLKKQRIGIIGGEPSLHPNFEDIVNKISLFSKINDLPMPTIFTNGTLLKNFNPEIFQNTNCLINLNNPYIIGDIQWNNINIGLMKLEYSNKIDNINFGINLYHNMPDFSYIFEILQEFNKNSIRCSFVAPNSTQIISKEEYYTSGKEIFLNFINLAIKNKIKVHLDCNYIPICYFTDSEKQIIRQGLDPHKGKQTAWCEPVFDVTPDYKVVSCFGISKPVNLFDFNNFNEIEHYFKFKQIYPLTLANDSGKCKNCNKFQSSMCQGGCLGFSKKITRI